MASRKRIGSVILGFVVGILGTVAFLTTCGHQNSLGRVTQTPEAAVAAPAPAPVVTGKAGMMPSFSSVAAKVVPSVVNIHSTKILRSGPMMPSQPFFLDPFLRQFFGRGMRPGMPRMRRPMEHKIKSLGSGVILSSDGYILTNYHVVAQADDVRVALPDKRVLPAKVKGKDPRTDLALLKVEAKGLTPIKIGDSNKLRVGDVVLAVGNPFGVGETVTMGIVSAVGRAGMGITDYEDFIQTDAAINPGNSGGALVNLKGELVGIPTAIVSRSGGYQGIGFAVPTALAKPIVASLKKFGKVTRGFLGVQIQEITPALAKAMKLPDTDGVLVADVGPGSAADKAGIKSGDVIRALDGAKITSLHRFRNSIAVRGKGAKVRLTILRDGHSREVTVQLGELPNESKLATAGATKGAKHSAWSGVEGESLSQNWRSKLNLPKGISGVVVTKVAPRSPAAFGGLMVGDVILEVNRRKVANLQAFRKAAKGRMTVVLVWRAGHRIFLGWNLP